MKRMTFVIGIVTLIVLGCASPRKDEPATEPLAVSSHQIRTGQEVFMTYCHQCHPGGSGGLAPAINNKPLPGWLMKTQVRRGLGTMPGFSPEQISDEQLDALVTYLQSLRKL